jgi:hypothetical protein
MAHGVSLETRRPLGQLASVLTERSQRNRDCARCHQYGLRHTNPKLITVKDCLFFVLFLFLNALSCALGYRTPCSTSPVICASCPCVLTTLMPISAPEARGLRSITCVIERFASTALTCQTTSHQDMLTVPSRCVVVLILVVQRARST